MELFYNEEWKIASDFWNIEPFAKELLYVLKNWYISDFKTKKTKFLWKDEIITGTFNWVDIILDPNSKPTIDNVITFYWEQINKR